jgi:hypothetical protein
MSDVTPQAAPAVALTDEETEERARACWELDQAIKAGMRAGREALWEVARNLHAFDEAHGWTAIGYDRLGDWLADPDVSLTRSTYYRLTATWRELVVLRRVDETRLLALDASKVDVVLPSVKAGKTSLDDALEDVQSLGMKDLRARYYKRPDPGQAGPGDDGPIDGTAPGVDPDTGAQVDDEPYVEPPPNPTDDVPKWADGSPIGGTGDVIDGTAVDIVPDAEVLDDDVDPVAEIRAAVSSPAVEPALHGKLEAADVVATLDAAIAEGARRQLLQAAQDARRFMRMIWGLDAEDRG